MQSYECLAVCCHVELCRPFLHCRPILSGVYAFRCILSRQVKLCLPCFVLSFHVELYVPRFCGDMLSFYSSLCNVALCQAAIYSCRFFLPHSATSSLDWQSKERCCLETKKIGTACFIKTERRYITPYTCATRTKWLSLWSMWKIILKLTMEDDMEWKWMWKKQK
jgi:hypothetical protein